MSHVLSKKTRITLFALALLTGGASVAQATTVTAAYPAGKSSSPSCIGENFGAAQNACSTTVDYLMSVPTDFNSHVQFVQLRASCISGSAPVSCVLVGKAPNASSSSASFQTISCNGTSKLTAATVNLSAESLLYVRCELPPGAAIQQVMY